MFQVLVPEMVGQRGQRLRESRISRIVHRLVIPADRGERRVLASSVEQSGLADESVEPVAHLDVQVRLCVRYGHVVGNADAVRR